MWIVFLIDLFSKLGVTNQTLTSFVDLFWLKAFIWKFVIQINVLGFVWCRGWKFSILAYRYLP